MAKPPAESGKPAKLTNDKRAAYHKRLAIHILLTEQAKVISNRMKANIKAATDEGLPGKKIKVTHDLAKKAPSEVARHYAEEFELLEFQGVNIVTQYNLLGGADVIAPKKGPDYYAAGLFAGLDGKDGNPPKNLKGPDQQRWIEGWQDAVAARILGKEYLDNAEAQLRAAGNDGKKDEPDPAQTTLEGAIEATEVIRIGLSDFGPNAKLEDIELADCDLEADRVEKAKRIEIVDADGRTNVLKDADGGTLGLKDGFAMTQQELEEQKARPSTIAATDPAAAAVDTKH